MYRKKNASRSISVALVFVSIFAFDTFTGCTGKKSQVASKTDRPLILFAVDGLEWRVIKPLLAAGRLPVLAGLMERGTYGYLESMLPTFSAVIWTTIATGKIPKKHGILNFVYQAGVDESGEPNYRYYTSGHRSTKAFWNILSDYSLAVNCIGWWMTYPVESINGIMVSQTNTMGVLKEVQQGMMKGGLLKGVEGQVHPPELQNRVIDLLEEVDNNLEQITTEVYGDLQNPLTPFGRKVWKQSQWAFRADATYIRVARDILESKEPFDVLALYIGSTDVTAHRFWRYAYPQEFDHPPPGEQIENFGRIIDDTYVYTDKIIGEILSMAPEDAAVMIVSDHGMQAENADREFAAEDPPWFTLSANHLDAPPGVFIAAGIGIQQADMAGLAIGNLDLSVLPTIGNVLDITPTLLALMGIPVGKDMYGVPLRGIMQPVWLEKVGIQHLPTHDTDEWLANRSDRIKEAIDQEERLEQLRSLGYIE